MKKKSKIKMKKKSKIKSTVNDLDMYDLYLDNTSLGKMSNQFSHLNRRFKRLQE